MEGLGGKQTEKGREGETCNAEEEICGEIIIPGVTAATFFEVDVNKILSYTIHFNFTSERMLPKGRGGCVRKIYVKGKKRSRMLVGRTHPHRHKRISV